MRRGLAAATAADITTVKEQNEDEGSLRLISQRCVLHLQIGSPASLSLSSRLFMMKEVGEFVHCPQRPEHPLSNYREAGYPCLSQRDSCEQTHSPPAFLSIKELGKTSNGND